MKSILLIVISFFCKAGTLTNYQTNIQYKLECPDSRYESCFFDVELPMGDYMYVSSDKEDTTILMVTDTKYDTYIYRTTGNFIFTR